jgi:hypothetical protein
VGIFFNCASRKSEVTITSSRLISANENDAKNVPVKKKFKQKLGNESFIVEPQ